MGSKIFWALSGGFLVGVFLRSFFALGRSFVFLCMLLSLATLVFIFFDRQKTQALIVLSTALLFCGAGMARMQVAALEGDPSLTARLGQSVAIEGVVFQEPDARDTSTLVSIRADTLVSGASTTPVRAEVLAHLPAGARVSYGDRVQVEGTLELPQSFDTGEGRQFDYPEYLAAQGIGYSLSYARLDSIQSRGGGDPLKRFALGAKEEFLRGIQLVLPEPEAALAGGITVGDKRSVGPELSADFQRDSLTHMLVLSGYNITVVLNWLAQVLQFLPRVLQFSGSIFVVIFFVLLSGGASSASRAGLMALIATFARHTHRIYLGERALAAVSLAMVAWNPWTLCFDPSFQLSALATLGLILFTPTFAAWFARVPERFGTREILASTCATQLAVLPLLLYQNGMLSLVALPANLLALLPVPAAMFFSSIAAFGGMALGSWAAPLGYPAYALLWYIIHIAKLFSSLPFAALSIPAFGAVWLFVAYAGLFGAFAVFRWVHLDPEKEIVLQ